MPWKLLAFILLIAMAPPASALTAEPASDTLPTPASESGNWLSSRKKKRS